MPRTKRLPATLFSAACLAMSGCAVLEIRDVYRDENRAAQFSDEATELAFWFEPDTRFYSFGPAGLPIIPTRVAAVEATELALTLTLRLSKDLDFSLATSPCLIVEAGGTLCSENLDLRAVAMAQDDGTAHKDKRPRWGWLPEFVGKPHLTITTNVASSARVKALDIYDHYQYQGTPWGYYLVKVTYRINCGGPCPATFKFDASDLVHLGELTPFSGEFTFAKARERDYEPLTPVQ